MEEIEAHLDDTWFAWVEGADPEAVFYFRLQSPVVLIEFDHPGTRSSGETPVDRGNHQTKRGGD